MTKSLFKIAVLSILWWAALLGLWLLFVDSSAIPEVVAGIGAAVIGAAAAGVVRSQRSQRFHPLIRWLRYAWQLPWRVVVDCAVVLAALWRRLALRQPVQGKFRTVPLNTGGADPTSAAWRAFVVAATSVAPNTFVVGIDTEQGVALIHELAPAKPDAVKDRVVGAL